MARKISFKGMYNKANEMQKSVLFGNNKYSFHIDIMVSDFNNEISRSFNVSIHKHNISEGEDSLLFYETFYESMPDNNIEIWDRLNNVYNKIIG